VRLLEASSDKLFCAAENGLFSRDLSSGETRKLSKIDGLSDTGVTAMAYGADGNILVIGYASGIIDLIFSDRIVGITNIANSNLNRDKRINDISIDGSKAFVASDFGVVVVDFDQEEITDNFLQIGENGGDVAAEEVVIQNDSLFVITDEGIQTGVLTDNLLDFNNWSRYSRTAGFVDLETSAEGLFALDGSNLVRFQGGAWVDTGADLPATGGSLLATQGRLFSADRGVIYEYQNGFFEIAVSSTATQVNDLYLDENADLLIADAEQGLIDGFGTSLSPDGPLWDDFSKLRVLQDELYGFNAPSAAVYDGSQQEADYSVFSNGVWSKKTIDEFTNISDVSLSNGLQVFSSIGDGLYIEGEGILKDIPGSLSSLDTLLTGIQLGQELFLVGYGQESLHVLASSGEWQSYSSAELFSNQLEDVEVSQLGVVWMRSASGSITILDPDQNEVDVINTADGLPAAALDFNISLEDDVWVATSQGPASFADASFIFSETEAFLPTFESKVLFEGERINAVLTDGGNRVWFGTNRGLWVFDENTSRLDYLFDESNSPIPSNTILDLAYNERSGEVFVSTDKGMISYRSASSVGPASHSNVKVFPNPVRPEYQGQVGITGLARNALLKVTDVNGNLVQEIEANGGAASWDLLNVNGERVVTGIYYFFSSTFDGGETFVGKIAVVR